MLYHLYKKYLEVLHMYFKKICCAGAAIAARRTIPTRD